MSVKQEATAGETGDHSERLCGDSWSGSADLAALPEPSVQRWKIGGNSRALFMDRALGRDEYRQLKRISHLSMTLEFLICEKNHKWHLTRLIVRTMDDALRAVESMGIANTLISIVPSTGTERNMASTIASLPVGNMD